MYSQIAENKRKTWILISLFAAIIIALGWVFGMYLKNPSLGIIIATVVATIMTLIGYYRGDSVALAVSKAKKIEKRDLPQLYKMVENLAITDGLPTPDIYVINDPAANAFAAGRDPEHAIIAVTTGLIELMEPTELEGVLAHEMSHIRNYDIRVMTIVVVLVGTIMLLSDMLLRTFIYGRVGRRNNESNQLTIVLVVVGLILAILSPIFAEMIKLAVSRKREFLADASAALLTRYPEGLANALEKIAKQDQPLKNANHATAHLFLANPFDPHVTKKFESLFSTHPPINDRIAKLREMGA